MDLSHLAIQLLIAIACAGLANILIPRQVPGKFLGLIVIGLVGVWVGEFGFALLRTRYGLDDPILRYGFEGVPIIPSVIGSAIVLYTVTTFMSWGRYNR
jgi:uncharacterized membrane protein YeaQ/YmgE (transglycosylase-associated protein family)